MLIAGIDEAGRGPVIGPMVMACVVMSESDQDKLKMLGVKDSKLLSPEKREKLYIDILEIAVDYFIEIVSVEEIDSAVLGTELNLNKLEMNVSSLLLNNALAKCDVEKSYVDCPSINQRAYSSALKDKISKKDMRLVCEHKADVNYLVVSAASILAKVTRDREIQKLKDKFGVDFGSGYLTDPKSMDFLERNYNKYNFFRKSWKPWQRLNQKSSQKGLTNFGFKV